ncbi:Vitamin B12 transporter BtuB [Saliniradius amylolyticus]|uniref:Vitamin B12 transporter BtuB n=1 Tax=Saliniradius amylolyticus TaxID=2183582 RepID=A0A2S2E268_9ALTE|nr:TonB-dependent receptor [Saliniradius amylolyticus]AWL11350.1 Vitamin B12 transporter BtuB [Saliniradius amylolyticus]
MYTNSKLAKSVRLALAFGVASTATVAGNAIAQEEGADDVEKISVTGSRIKRTDMESASPISVFSAEDIEASGFTTLENFVQAVPAMNGGAEGSNVNNGSRGFATASLRGLGSGRTLVLINGRRYASGDLNSIPVSFVERVEVLRDGASTIYGSDAIAGVINFITKRDFEGVEITAQHDVTTENDGEITKFAVTTGTSSDKGNVVLALEYSDRNAIFQGDREFAECPIFERNGEKVCGGSGTIPYGQFFNANYSGHVVDPMTGEVRPFDQAVDGFNYATTSKMQTPQQVFSINGSATYEITNDTMVFAEGGFTNRKSDQLMAPEGTFWAPLMPATNPYNPVGEDIFVARRLRETAGREFTQDFSDYRMVFGFEGYFDNGVSWDLAYNYARYVDARLDNGRVNPTRIETLLDPAKCDDDAACPEVWNILEAGTLTDEMINYAFVPNSPIVRSTVKQLMGNLSGDFGTFELPGGAPMWAAGFEQRWEDYSNTPDGAASIGQIYSVAGDPTQGQFEVTEFYGEVSLPVLETVSISAAVRSTDYSFLDDRATNSKIGVEWEPLDGLLLRTTVADGFRAPSITELFAPQAETNLAYNDPCENYGSSNVSQTVKDNCAADGLPGNFELSSNQSSTVEGGNTELEPEESESLTAGVVYTHDSGFTAALDYFDIEITNGIGTVGTDNVVNGCYSSPDFSSPLCDFIEGPSLTGDAPHPTSPYRSALGTVAGVLLVNENLSTFQTSGVDFDFSYSMPMGAGDLSMRVDGTWLNEYTYLPYEGADVVEAAGKVAADQWETTLAVFPEWRTNIGLMYTAGDFSLNWTSRYQSEGEDIFASEDNLDNIADSIWYHDVQGTYYMKNYSFTLGVRNLLDEEPPYITNNQDMNTINQSYDVAGRYMYARVTAKF